MANATAMVIVCIFWWLIGFAFPAPIQARILKDAQDAPNLASTLISTAFNVGIGGGAILGGFALEAGWGYQRLPWISIAFATVGLVTALYLAMQTAARWLPPERKHSTELSPRRVVDKLIDLALGDRVDRHRSGFGRRRCGSPPGAPAAACGRDRRCRRPARPSRLTGMMVRVEARARAPVSSPARKRSQTSTKAAGWLQNGIVPSAPRRISSMK